MTHKRHLLTLLLSMLLMACASVTKDNPDPYEAYNRKMYGFNTVVDHLYIRPVAVLYSKSPGPVQKGVNNFLSNIKTLNSAANNLLQLKPKGIANDLGRFVINTTIGIAGLFDPATGMGLDPDRQDFGQTLARWGYRDSAYFVIPLLGPSTVRDMIGTGMDWTYLSASDYLIHSRRWRRTYDAVNFIDARTRALPLDKAIRQAFDPYVMVRNAYLQRRRVDIAKTTGKKQEPKPSAKAETQKSH